MGVPFAVCPALQHAAGQRENRGESWRRTRRASRVSRRNRERGASRVTRVRPLGLVVALEVLRVRADVARPYAEARREPLEEARD